MYDELLDQEVKAVVMKHRRLLVCLQFSERMEEATTRFSRTSVPPSADQARQEMTTHQEEKRGKKEGIAMRMH